MAYRTSWLNRLEQRSDQHPDEPVIEMLGDPHRVVEQRRWGPLVRDAGCLAGFLLERTGLGAGDRVLLAHPPGLAFVDAFLACLFAGLVPVPVYPPDPRRPGTLDALGRIAERAGARFVLTTRRGDVARRLGVARSWVTGASQPRLSLDWLVTEGRTGRHPPSLLRRDERGPDDVAFLQFTSGSTAAPRGVQVTFGNLDHQLALNRRALGLSSDSRLVAWVPQYHDFGLISGILSALGGNGRLRLIDPLAFLKRPRLWLEAISEWRATHTAAPNFGYELAMRKVDCEDLHGLDLSSLEVAMSAAEPIRAEAMRQFSAVFGPAGFRASALCPAYGLAEHTVGVTIGGRATVHASRPALSGGRLVPDPSPDESVELVGCGRPDGDVEVRIVDPERRAALPSDHVGEIWVRSPSKARGYHEDDEATRATFQARLVDEPDAADGWLRTGDLGVLYDEELFVVGRLKDMVILEGRNLYLNDVEDGLRDLDPRVRPGGIAAFAVPADDDDEGRERLGVVVEVRAERGDGYEGLSEAIRARVQERHGVTPAVVILARPRTVPKTTSGKVRRTACTARWQAGWSDRDVLELTTHAAPSETPARAPEVDASVDEVVCGVIASVLHLGDPAAVDRSRDLRALGMESVSALAIVDRLSEVLGRRVPTAWVLEHGSVEQLVAALGAPGPGAYPLADEDRGVPVVARYWRHPAGPPQPKKRVAVVGAGAAGLTAALELLDAGWREVVLYEAAEKVGGKVLSDAREGRTYELGQALFTNRHEAALALARRVGVHVPLGAAPTDVMSVDGLEEVDGPAGIAWFEQVVGALGLGPTGPTDAGMAGHYQAGLEVPARRWLEQRELWPPPHRFYEIWTTYGYGDLDRDIPMAYVAAYLRMIVAGRRFGHLPGGGNQLLWERVAEAAEDLGLDLRCGQTVRAVRPGAQPTVCTDAGEDPYDHVVLAVPPWVAARLLPEASPIPALARRFRTFDYRIALVEVQGLAPGYTHLLRSSIAAPHEGGPMFMMRCPQGPLDGRTPPIEGGDDVVVAQFGGPDPQLDDDALDQALVEGLAAVGVPVVAIHRRKRWPFFPHVGAEDWAAGILPALESLQGVHGIWLVGGWLALESVEHAVAHAQNLIRSNFTRGAQSRSVAEPAPIPSWTRSARPLWSGWAAGERAPIDAGAVVALPSSVFGTSDAVARGLQDAMGGAPEWTTVIETDLGRLGLAMVPVLDARVHAEPRLPGLVAAAARQLAVAGARAVALTGLIPSATDYGRALPVGDVVLTTGHAATIAAVVLNVQAQLRRAGRHLSEQRLAVVGLGSIGAGVLELLLEEGVAPRQVILADVFDRQGAVEQVADELRRRGIDVRVALGDAGQVAKPVYEASLVVGATSVPRVLDVHALASGALLIDDSAPHCFDTDAAWRRHAVRGDLQFTEGGAVALPQPAVRTVHVPPSLAPWTSEAELALWLGSDPSRIMGCMLSGLLLGARPELRPTLGPARLDDVRAHLAAMRALGLTAPPAHLEGRDVKPASERSREPRK